MILEASEASIYPGKRDGMTTAALETQRGGGFDSLVYDSIVHGLEQTVAANLCTRAALAWQ